MAAVIAHIGAHIHQQIHLTEKLANELGLLGLEGA
jgi:hypothetical protein